MEKSVQESLKDLEKVFSYITELEERIEELEKSAEDGAWWFKVPKECWQKGVLCISNKQDTRTLVLLYGYNFYPPANEVSFYDKYGAEQVQITPATVEDIPPHLLKR